jgi:CheY-like chemotaxis protein
VLVVDDEPSVRLVIVDALAEQGYLVHEAVDGRTGLAVLKSGVRIDLLLTDLGLPGGMTGQDLTDAARKWRPGLKVLFVTGLAKSVPAGATGTKSVDVIEKPFAISALLARVHGLIGAQADGPPPPLFAGSDRLVQRSGSPGPASG